jgi:alpha-tubulin suppressor-like RCC1 family protein
MALSAGTDRWFGTGYNGNGQLGLGDTTQRTTFTQLTGNWSQIAGGSNHTMALSTGTTRLFATGYNQSGQLGLGNNGSGTDRNTFTQLTGNWSQVTCGSAFTMAQSAGSNNTWFGTGTNYDGQLGLGTSGNETNTFTQLTGNWSQMACGELHTMAITYTPTGNTLSLSTCITDQYTQFAGLSTGLFLPVSVNNVAYKIPLYYPGSIVTISSISVS